MYAFRTQLQDHLSTAMACGLSASVLPAHSYKTSGHSYDLWTSSICAFRTKLQDVGLLLCSCSRLSDLHQLWLTPNVLLTSLMQREVKASTVS